jgi:NAD(P)-dependent dehydrogenase (short-subunit alcohol dehydrogenase family)
MAEGTSLEGRLALITGANRGIGHAIAERFLAEGARCILTVRNQETAASMLGRFPERTTELEVCDLADPSAIAALGKRVRARHATLGILVNNGAVFLQADRAMTADQLDPAVLRATFDVNLFGTIEMCRTFAPMMPRGGRIINLSSTMGQLDGGLEPYAVAYSISKSALNAYTSALAAALHKRGILVDAYHPGWVKTEMGGPGAQREPGDASSTALFLATRTAGGRTGRFWLDDKPIPW